MWKSQGGTKMKNANGGKSENDRRIEEFEWLEKEEKKLERLLKKALRENEGEWVAVRKVSRVVVINEDE